MSAPVSREMRDVLLEHVDGGRPLVLGSRSRGSAAVIRRRTVAALIGRGWLAYDARGCFRARWTVLTDAGRAALASILAEYAEVLVRAGALHPESLTPGAEQRGPIFRGGQAAARTAPSGASERGNGSP